MPKPPVRRWAPTRCVHTIDPRRFSWQTGGHGDHTEQFAKIEHCLPTQRGNVSLSNLQVVNAILYVAEHGCKWRGLPKRFGNWHTIYTRMNRWTKAGVLDRMFEELQRAQVVRIKIEAVSLDSTSIKVHPDGTGALKKTGHKPLANIEVDGTPRFIWLPRMLAQHSVLAVPRSGTRCAGRKSFAEPPWRTGETSALAHGSRLRRQ